MSQAMALPARIGSLVPGIDFLLATLAQEVADELPQHCRPSLFAKLRRGI
jgi:hypothetical protein